MDPSTLRQYLDVLRAAGVRSAKLPDLEVEFEERLVPVSGLMDKDGNGVDLDEGNPWKAQGDEYDPMAVQRANSPKKDTK